MSISSNFSDPVMSEFVDKYRQYPLRALGYVNAICRPLRDLIPKPVYQLSLGLMHTYFLTNSYDYALRVDSKNRLSSAVDCYTWHCAGSWIGPAMVVDGTVRFARKYTNSRAVPILISYAALGLASPLLDRALNWYFYGFWSAGNKERPKLSL